MRITITAFALTLFTCSTALAANVRTDRPRILLGNGSGLGTTPATFKSRCTSDPDYQARCTSALSVGGGLYPAMNDAAGYIVNADPARCNKAYSTLQMVAAATPGQPDPHGFISSNAREMLQLAAVRDWCDPVLTAAQKTWIEGKITGYADWVLSGMNGYALDVYLDDMNNVWSSVALAGLALTGTAQDTKAQSYVAAADNQWKKVIFPALAYEGDFWHEGFTYVAPALDAAVVHGAAWSIATDENLFTYAHSNANDLFNGYIDFFAYTTRPDYSLTYFGDTTDNKQTVQLFMRPYLDMMTLGTGSTLGQGFSDEIKANVPAGYDYSGADGYMLALFYDASKDSTATTRSTLPTSGWLSRGAADVAIMRSGWGKSDTFVYVSCGDYFGSHQHIEVGEFQILKGAELTGSSGYYDNFGPQPGTADHWDNYYSQHSVHANTIAVYQPGEFFPTTQTLTVGPSANVNDGGQRPLRRDKTGGAYPNPDLPTYLTHKTAAPFVDTGNILTFEQTSCHSYVACDATNAYSTKTTVMNGNTPKLDEVSRQFVYLPPNVLVVFDRVDALDPTYQKRFLLQSPANPQVSGANYTLKNGSGTLFAETMLPTGATANIVTNFNVNGTPYPPTVTGNESFGTRIEVVAPSGQTRDYFLHVLGMDTTAPTSSMTQDSTTATLNITAPQGKYTLTFAKTGTLAGHVTSMDSGGKVTCDETLGANAQSPDAGIGNPAGGGTNPNGGGTNPDGGGTNPGGGGTNQDGATIGGPSSGSCGCTTRGNTTNSPVGNGVALATLIGLILRIRRRS
jgi:MYXO-CTERM domain-containing protein